MSVPASGSIDKVLLSFPSLISLRDGSGDHPRSWEQVARTGSFVSNRYGKFSITKDDLSSMVKNFREVTPKAPTELPIDYDHLSMDPKKPGDGAAAGWFKALELRGEGDELWAEIEWTPPAAKAIVNKEYRFVSPSFVKNHKHKDGTQIGTTLLAAAITNHPFLEGMKALTLYNFSALGDLAVNTPDETVTVNLAEVGQRVMIAPGSAHTQDQIGGSFEIVEVVGEGDDAFVSVKDASGAVHSWFRATELLPASSTPASPATPPLTPVAGVVPGSQGDAPVVPQAPGAPTPSDALADAVVAATGAEPKAGEPNESVKPADNAGEATVKEGATGADDKSAEKTAEVERNAGDVKSNPVDSATEIDGLTEIIKKILASLGQKPAVPAVPLPKGIAHMKFTLRNDKNEEVVITAEQLTAAGITIVQDGQVAVPATELTTLKDSVTNLSQTVASMKTAAETAATEARAIELNATLDRLSKEGKITKPTRDAIFDQFKGATDLAGFHALCATFTTPIVSLNKAHGSGGDVKEEKAVGEAATDAIIELSNKLVKEEGMSLREATIEASRRLKDESEAYREQFAEV